MCCALVGIYPAYMACVLSSHYADRLWLSHLCIARTDSPILDNIYRKFHNFDIGTFKFHLTSKDEYVNFPDYFVYEITHDGVTVPFLFTVIEVAVPCGLKSKINLAVFMLENASMFAFRLFGIVCVPLNTPTVLYLHPNGTTRGGWTPNSLCKVCLNEFEPILTTIICDSTGTRSCKCNVCLRKIRHSEIWLPTLFST